MSDVLEVLPPRLPQGHSPSGDPQCMEVVWMQASSGDVQVNGSEPSQVLTPWSLSLPREPNQLPSAKSVPTAGSASNKTLALS